MTGIEPAPSGWKPEALPLDDIGKKNLESFRSSKTDHARRPVWPSRTPLRSFDVAPVFDNQASGQDAQKPMVLAFVNILSGVIPTLCPRSADAEIQTPDSALARQRVIPTPHPRVSHTNARYGPDLNRRTRFCRPLDRHLSHRTIDLLQAASPGYDPGSFD